MLENIKEIENSSNGTGIEYQNDVQIINPLIALKNQKDEYLEQIKEQENKVLELKKSLQEIDYSSKEFTSYLKQINELTRAIEKMNQKYYSFDNKLEIATQSIACKDDLKDYFSIEVLTDDFISSIKDYFKDYNVMSSVSVDFKIGENGNLLWSLWINDGANTAKRIKGKNVSVKNFDSIEKPSGSLFKFHFAGKDYLLSSQKEVSEILDLTGYQARFLSNSSAYNSIKSKIESLSFADANGNEIEKVF